MPNHRIFMVSDVKDVAVIPIKYSFFDLIPILCKADIALQAMCEFVTLTVSIYSSIK